MILLWIRNGLMVYIQNCHVDIIANSHLLPPCLMGSVFFLCMVKNALSILMLLYPGNKITHFKINMFF